MTPAALFDPDPDGMAPAGAPVVQIIPATGGGDQDAADALIEASPQVELFDETFWGVPKRSFHPLIGARAGGPAEIVVSVASAVSSSAWPVVLADDLSSVAPLLAGPFSGHSLCHLGARAQLSGAGAIGRALKALKPPAMALSLTVRSLEAADAALMTDGASRYQALIHGPQGLTPSRGAEAASDGGEAADVASLLAALPEGPLLLAVEADLFGPGLMPTVANPIPGGADWAMATALAAEIFAARPVAGLVMALHKPVPSHHASDFLLAKWLYKLLSYRFFTGQSPIFD